MGLPASVRVVEVSPRDGFQIEKNYIATETKVKIINSLLKCGIKKIEATSFISPKAIPQMKDASEVIAGIVRDPGVKIAALVPNSKGAENAARAGVDEMVIFLSATESHNKSNVNRTIRQSLEGFADVLEIAKSASIDVATGICVAFGCPFEGDVEPEKIERIVDRILDMGVETVTLGDTTGMATPRIVQRTCEHLMKKFSNIDISLHFHDTRALGLVNIYAALQIGLTTFESSVAGLGGCPFAPGATGNVCTEDMIYMFHELGIETGIDLDALINVSRKVEKTIGRTLPGKIMKSGPRNKLSRLACN